MKRFLVKKWDKVNGQLTVRYYRVGKDQIILREYESPMFLSAPGLAKHKMSRKYIGDFFYGINFVKELASMI